ncbi:MAG: ABC-three component system protein [Clostridium botulinum]|uniref:ABC-three component system protein n=1 Tax=uncultured Clostridium sp. TaxID=59620 RepID=UPI00280A5E7A|nr:ABC-three component system protein [uncultured Clostridium sp.]MDU6876636.1 ABC-three component system protein [Clostridium botulinum]
MKKLCFGTYATILKRCMAKRVTQKRLCGTMLLSVAPTYDISGEDGTVSDLILGKKNLSPIVTDTAPGADPHDISDYFKQSILQMLDSNKRSLIVLALKDIITSDNSIEPDTIVEIVNGMTKQDIMNRNAFVLEEFLAGVFLYTVLYVENRNCESSVSEITDEYIQAFEDQKLDISFIKTYSNLSQDTAYEIAIDAHSLVLLAETGGKCQKCGRVLGIKKEGNDINYAKVVRLSETDEVVLCVECEREIQSASEEEKLALLSDKRDLENLIIARDATSRYTIERQIEQVLREVNLIDVTDDTQLKIEPVKVENKITEKRLKDRVLFDVRQLYEGVNDSLYRLAGENRLNVDKFAKNVRRMYEDASESHISQSEIYYLLVETLFEKTGRKYRGACEIIISYFVQRCEVFDEITK